MKLTATQRDAFVRSVLKDVPQVDYTEGCEQGNQWTKIPN